jgi:hypothetical protein
VGYLKLVRKSRHSKLISINYEKIYRKVRGICSIYLNNKTAAKGVTVVTQFEAVG